MMLRDTNLQVSKKQTNKKQFHTFSFLHFAFIFSEYTRFFISKRLWKCASTISFRKHKRKVVIYLFNYDSYKSIFLIFILAFDVLLSTFLILSRNTKITRTSCSMFWYVLFYKNLLFSIMVIIIFYSILASVSNSHFQQ